MEAARGDGKPHSAQDTLPFRQIYPDGLCKLDDKSWSRCIEFEDVNYQLAQPDGQTAIFEALCDMYNTHDASIGMELSLVCRKVNKEDFRKRIEIAAQGDRFDGVRALYTDMLRRQLEHGNNGMVKTKFLVLTIEAKKASRPIPPVQTVATTSKKTSKTTKTVTRKQTGDQLQNLSNGVGSYKESTAQLTAVKSDLDEIQLQMDKVMLAQG